MTSVATDFMVFPLFGLCSRTVSYLSSQTRLSPIRRVRRERVGQRLNVAPVDVLSLDGAEGGRDLGQVIEPDRNHGDPLAERRGSVRQVAKQLGE